MITEAELAGLGVHRIPIPIPFPAAGGPVNAYAIEDAGGGLLLLDTGLCTPEALDALRGGFAALGRRFDEVVRIVVSHGHVDHYGAARTVQEWHGGAPPPVFAHPADHPKLAETGPRWAELAARYVPYLRRQGVPEEALAVIATGAAAGFDLGRRLPEVHALGPGEVLRTRHLALEVLHMPGHTPGLLCLHDRARRLLFSDDHLLERVSPNPLIELGPDGQDGFFRPLLAYVDSLARTRALEVDLVLPGHGPPFGGHRQVIDALLGFYEKRQRRIRALLADGPLTAHEVARRLFPLARPDDTFLVMSETIANLEVMAARGEVTEAREDAPWGYRLAG